MFDSPRSKRSFLRAELTKFALEQKPKKIVFLEIRKPIVEQINHSNCQKPTLFGFDVCKYLSKSNLPVE